MRKLTLHIVVVLLALSCSHETCARSWKWGEICYGAEWGYTATMFEWHHFNFLNPELMMIDIKGTSFNYHSNAYVSAHVGLEFYDRLSVRAHIGYEGIDKLRRAIPISLRENVYLKGYHYDGVFLFLEEGYFVLNTYDSQPAVEIRLGSGYRFALAKHMNLDFMVSLHLSSDHPNAVIDQKTKKAVPDSYVNRSDATYTGISFSTAINF